MQEVLVKDENNLHLTGIPSVLCFYLPSMFLLMAEWQLI